MIEIKGSHNMIFGLKGTGKSNFLQYLLSMKEYNGNIVYDVAREHQNLNTYTPNYRQGEEAKAEVDGFLNSFVMDNKTEMRPNLIALEEVSRFAPTRGSMPDALSELVDLNRHYGIGFVGIARRPAQVDTDLVEMADNIFIFRLTGANDVKKLNRMVDGLGDTVKELDDYHYVQVKPDRTYEVRPPVDEMDSTGNL